MIPILQFDVSTLSIVYDTQLLSSARGSRTLGMALEFGISGDDSKLRALLRLEKDIWVQTRAATIASCVWHEKRHFLDFVLTNYGARRIRQFFGIYVNANTVLAGVRDSGALALPLDVNLCPIMRDRLGVSRPCSEILKVAESLLSMKEENQDERKPVETRGGQIEIGGHAQLEAIAYYVQMYKAQREFGHDLYRPVAKDTPSGKLNYRKYTWMYDYMVRAGILRGLSLGADDLLVGGAPFISFCYGALAGRFYGQEEMQSGSRTPKDRFVRLLMGMKKHYPNYADLSTMEAWKAVNVVCSKLFGRDVVEETEADYEQEEKLLRRFEEKCPNEDVIKCYSDFHMLRGRMIDMLRDSPELILQVRDCSDKLIAMLRPNIVVSAPAGIFGAPPDNIALLSGYLHPVEAEGERAPDTEWWWTGMVKHDMPSDDQMALRDSRAWVSLASHFAPLGKLFMDGMALRTMMGPELMSAIQRVRHLTGVQLVIDNAFIGPRERYNALDWGYATGKVTFRCELSNDICTLDEGVLLDTWDIRLREEYMRTLINSLPDHLQAQQTMTFIRDWSPWMVKRKYADKLQRIPIDKTPYSCNR